MKKHLKISLIALLSLSILTACANNNHTETSESSKEVVTKETKEFETKESEIKESETKESETKESETKESETKEPETKESETKSGTESSNTKTNTNFSSTKYANTDKLEISINGKIYELGKSTLQDLINDNVKFKESDLANASNNVEPNAQSSIFRIMLGDYWELQVWTANYSESGKPANELPIADIYYVHKENENQDIVKFNFPFTLTIDELKSNSGEPTKVNHYDSNDGYTSDDIDYRIPSTKYLKDGGYTFGFIREKFNSVRITYIP